MGKFTLEELECDEIHAALIERRDDLNKRKTKLIEDSLPEAAEGVGARLRLYDGHSAADGSTRPGLVRMFAPQRDIEAEADQQRRNEKRRDDGQQDAFGGGAETGGATRAASSAAPTASAKAAPTDTAGAEVIDVDYEIIPQGRRIASTSTLTIESALKILAQMARVLLAGPAFLNDPEYDNFALAVVAVLPALNPDVDPDYVEAQVMVEYRDSEDNAHQLAHYIERNVALIQDRLDNPIAPPVHADAPEGTEPPDDAAKSTDPVDDGTADTLRKVVWPADAAPAAAPVDELSFETPADRGTTSVAGETNPPAGDTKPAIADTKAPAADTPKAPDTPPAKKGKGGGRKKKN